MTEEKSQSSRRGVINGCCPGVVCGRLRVQSSSTTHILFDQRTGSLVTKVDRGGCVRLLWFYVLYYSNRVLKNVLKTRPLVVLVRNDVFVYLDKELGPHSELRLDV